MSAASPLASPASLAADSVAPYRAISRSAVMAIVAACLALPIAILTVVSANSGYGGDVINLGAWTAIISLFAVVFGLLGLLTIRRYPLEYTGKNLARTALLMGIVQLVLGASLASYTYATEVPDGYSRVWFYELRPDPENPLPLPISQRAIDLNEKPIFIKGYIHPGVAGTGKVDHFILVPDMGTCCFGGQPKPWDMIEVHVKDRDDRVAYSTRTMKLMGKFEISPNPGKTLGLTDVWYHMEVDDVK
jgi:hypothetical protein